VQNSWTPWLDEANKQHQAAILAVIYPVSAFQEQQEQSKEDGEFLLHGTLRGFCTLPVMNPCGLHSPIQ